MMYGREKSDPAIVATKPANNAGRPAAEWVEPRAGTEGNANQTHTRRAQNRESVSQGLDRVRQLARQHKKMRFTTLLLHVTVERLSDAFYALKRKASPGVDGVTWQSYEVGLECNLRDLHSRVHAGRYRALPVLRRYIPKGDGGLRPLGMAALEDKLVQSVMVDVLNAIYEEDFLGFSYGFRPGRSQHDALDALAAAIQCKPVNWILDADIRSFLDRPLQCPLVYELCSKRSVWSLTALIRKPLRRPLHTRTASSSPRFTRCNTVWRETPSNLVASCITT